MKTPELDKLKNIAVKCNTIYEQFQSREATFRGYSSDDLYTALGFPQKIYYRDYEQRYRRQDIANRIVKAPVDGSWRTNPRIYESDDKTRDIDTAFETAIDKLSVDLQLYYHLAKLDLLAALGQYSVLFLGLQDGKDPAMPADTSQGISYVTPVPENRADIQTWENDTNSPRFGLPLTYTITVNTEVTGSIARTAHWTRTIHVAENTLDSEVYGIPFLEPVYNRLIGLDKLAGGSPEMYWRGARPGYTASSSENTIISDDEVDNLTTQLSNFVNNMQRWLYVEGMDIKALAPQVVSPSDHVDVQLKLISSVTRIPIRILTGSERGELASSQDERAWLTFLEERRTHVIENLILRPTIDRFIELNLVPPPSSGEYFIEWEPLLVASEKEKAEITKMKIEALDTYTGSIGGQELIPNNHFLKMLGFTEEEVELMLAVAADSMEEEDSINNQAVEML